MTINVHVDALVRAKQTELRKLTTKAMVAAAVIIVGGFLRPQWPILAELVAMAGLLAVGWIGRRIWDVAQNDTKFYG
jgi:hypothetical protein